MLIVIAVIVLAISLAVPAIRSLTGSRSQAAGQNVISAFLSRARAEAIGLQRVQGVLFFIDPATDRVNMAQVVQSPNEGSRFDAAGVTYLDLTADRDVVALPPGIRLQMLKDSASRNGNFTAQLFSAERYLGFNQTFSTLYPIVNPVQTPLGGVILFDAEGRLIVRQYGFRYANYPVNAAGQYSSTSVPTPLGLLAFQAAPDPALAARAANQNSGIWPTAQQSFSQGQVLRSQIGFVLFDREAFRTQTGTNGANFTDANGTIGTDKNNWLDQNATPILVNRYNGTLLRAE